MLDSFSVTEQDDVNFKKNDSQMTNVIKDKVVVLDEDCKAV